MKLQRKLVIILSAFTTLSFSFGISKVMQQNKYGEFDMQGQQKQSVATTEVNIENDEIYEETEIRTAFGAETAVTDTNIMQRESGITLNGVTTYYAIGARRSGNDKYTADLISTITFKKGIDAPVGTEASWDVSYTNTDQEVLAFIVPSSAVSGKYDLYIGTKGDKISLPENAGMFLANYTNLTEINGIELLDSSNTTEMRAMFYGDASLRSIDLSTFNTTNLTSMWDIFNGCTNITSIDLSGFNTSNVQYFTCMFCNCRNLKTVKINKDTFITSNVTNMSYMFYNCNNLREIDVSNFDTSKVTDMNSMFEYCDNLKNVDVSKFDTSNVTTMKMMFFNCVNLTNLDVSNFNTSNVTNMYYMFGNCYALKQIDISNFDISNVTTIMGMFSNDINLEIIKFGDKFNTSKVTGIAYMFYNCAKLTKLNTSVLNTESVNDMRAVFSGCSGLQVIDMSNFDTTNVLWMGKFVEGCTSLKSVILNKTITSSDQALKLITGDDETRTHFEDLPNVILYVPDTASEKLYEAATDYSTIFADSRDTEGDLYRIRPILELDGSNPIKIITYSTYDETVDAGAKIAGFEKTESGEYAQYGYNYTTSGLPVDTTATGTKQIIYTLTSTKDGVTTNGMSVMRNVNVIPKPVLMTPSSANVFGSTFNKSIVTKFVILNDSTKTPTTYIENGRWDVSAAGHEGTVYAYLTLNADATTHTLYIVADGNIEVTSGCDLFSNYANLASIEGMEYLDTSKATDMSWMFAESPKLTSIDISMLDTSSATNMTAMFYKCSGATRINVTGIDTSKVTNMSKSGGAHFGVFEGCSSLTSIDVSGFDTSNVVYMKSMFRNCEKLESLDLRSFDTSKSPEMDNFLLNAYALKIVVLGAKVTNIIGSSFINRCDSLEAIIAQSATIINLGESNNYVNLKVALYVPNALEAGYEADEKFSALLGESRIKPILALEGNSVATAGIATKYIDAGATVAGFTKSNVSEYSKYGYTLTSTSNVNISQIGSYKFTYTLVYNVDGEAKPRTEVVTRTVNIIEPVLKAPTSANIFGSSFNKSTVTKFIITNNFDNAPKTYVENGCWDISETGYEGSVYAYLTLNNDGATHTLYVVAGGIIKVTFGYDLFSHYNNCTSIEGMEYLDTSSVTDMSWMFYEDSKLTSIDISMLDTSSVITMESMFASCTAATSINLNGINTTNVKYMGKTRIDAKGMFEDCISLNSIDLSGLDTSSIENMNSMFKGCTAIKNINMSGLNLTKLLYMDDTFINCSNLTTIDFSGTTTKELTNLSGTFKECNKLESVDMSTFDTSKVTAMFDVFYNCTSLTSLDLSNFNTSKVTNMNRMFYNCASLTSLNLSNFDTNAATLDNFLLGATSLKTVLLGPKFNNLNGENVFTRNDSLVSVIAQSKEAFSNFGTATYHTGATKTALFVPSESVDKYKANENISAVFREGGIRPILELVGGEKVSVSQFSTYVDDGAMVAGITKESDYTQYGYTLTSTGSVNTSEKGTYTITYTLTYSVVGEEAPRVETVTRSVIVNASVLKEPTLTSIFGSSFNKNTVSKIIITDSFDNTPTSYIENGYWDISAEGYENTVFACLTLNDDGVTHTLHIIGNSKIRVTVARDLFSHYNNCTSIEGMECLDMSSVTDMSWMFAESSVLSSVDLTNMDTSKVTNMEYMFYNCSGLTNINVSGFNTSNVTNMRNMFAKCTSLTRLDLSNFKTPNLTLMLYMFSECTNLTYVDMSNFDTSNVENMQSLFFKDTVLKEIIGIENFNTGKVLNMRYMFMECESLTSLDLSNFDTSVATLDNFLLSTISLKTVLLGPKFNSFNGVGVFNRNNSLQSIIAQSKEAFSNFETSSYYVGAVKTNLYVPSESLEKYKADENISRVFNYGRIRPILELVGEKEIAVGQGSDYVDAGATVAGFDKKNAINYTQYGYTLTSTSNVDTSKKGKYTITYTLTYSVVGEDKPRVETITRIVTVNNPVLKAPTSANIFGSSFSKNTVTKIIITNSFDNAPTSYVENGYWDISATGHEGTVFAFLTLNSDGATHTLYIVAADTIKVTVGCDLFANFPLLTSIEGMEYLNTSSVTDMSWMFSGSSSLTNIDISMLDTSSVTTMEAMFADCGSVVSINLDGIDTSKVKYMGKSRQYSKGMFENCLKLESVDISNFNTSNVITLENMFKDCNSITNINIGPNFNTTKVTTMESMFENCYALTTLDLSTFDTTNVTTMNNFLLADKALKTVIFGEKFNIFNGSSILNQNNALEMIIAQSSTAIQLPGDNYVQNKSSIVYVPTKTAEKLYESADKYSTLFSSSNDTDDDMYRIKPILELSGDASMKVSYKSEYTDEGVTVLGFKGDNVDEYNKYGYTLSVSGLPLDTSIGDKHEIKYTLNYTRPGSTTTKKIDEVVRTIDIDSTITNINNAEITLERNSYVYTGAGIEPVVTVIHNGKTLAKNVDYTVNYENNIYVGTATVKIIGIGDYAGTVTKSFEITPAEIIGNITISGDPTYGEQLRIDFSNVIPSDAGFTFAWFYNLLNSTEGGTRLNDDYGIPESNEILIIDKDLVGKYIYAQVTVTADNYQTKVLTAFAGRVKARNINELDASFVQNVLVYDGNEKRPGVLVYDNYTGEELTLNRDYTLVYKNNVKPGTAAVTVTGMGDYTGERTLNFLIISLPTVKVENITPEWRAKDTIIQITIVDSGAGIKNVSFKGPGHLGDSVTLTNNIATVTVDENGTYYFEVYDIYNNVVTTEILISNIDKNAPIIENVSYDSNTFATKVDIKVRAADTESGVYAYSISSSTSTPTTWKKLSTSTNLVSFDTEIATNGIWYLFVKDLAGNVSMYNEAIIINNIDNKAPVIKSFDIDENYTFTTEVFIHIEAEDDTRVEEILVSNKILTTSQVESSADWIPFTETILYTLPNKDGEHTVYAWVKDSVGNVSKMASDSTMLLQKYVGNNGINSTSFKFLIKDENYDYANKLTGNNIKVAVKDDNGDITYSTDYGMNITSITLPTVYGPQQEETQIMSGEYYTITIDNLRGNGTVYLIFNDSAIADLAGNKLENTEVKTDVIVELNAPTISLSATEIQVSDDENNLVQAIKINEKTILLTGGKITYAKLKSDYGITLKTGDRVEAFDKCGNMSAVEVQ